MLEGASGRCQARRQADRHRSEPPLLGEVTSLRDVARRRMRRTRNRPGHCLGEGRRRAGCGFEDASVSAGLGWAGPARPLGIPNLGDARRGRAGEQAGALRGYRRPDRGGGERLAWSDDAQAWGPLRGPAPATRQPVSDPGPAPSSAGLGRSSRNVWRAGRWGRSPPSTPVIPRSPPSDRARRARADTSCGLRPPARSAAWAWSSRTTSRPLPLPRPARRGAARPEPTRSHPSCPKAASRAPNRRKPQAFMTGPRRRPHILLVVAASRACAST